MVSIDLQLTYTKSMPTHEKKNYVKKQQKQEKLTRPESPTYPACPMRLRSTQIANDSPSKPPVQTRNQSRLITNQPSVTKPTKGSPSPKPQVLTIKQEIGRGTLLTSQPNPMPKTKKTSKKKPQMKVQTVTVRDLQLADQNGAKSEDASPVVDYPKRRHKLTVSDDSSSSNMEAPVPKRRIHRSKKELSQKGVSSSQTSREKKPNKSKGKNISHSKDTSRPPPSPAYSQTSKLTREPSMDSSASISEALAERVRGLSFVKFKQLKLNAQNELVYCTYFAEEDDRKKMRQLDFSQSQLKELSVILGRNLKIAFLQEYVIVNCQRL